MVDSISAYQRCKVNKGPFTGMTGKAVELLLLSVEQGDDRDGMTITLEIDGIGKMPFSGEDLDKADDEPCERKCGRSGISFRGKRITDGKWVYGYAVCEDNGTSWISRYYHRGEWEQVDPATVGQFTGTTEDYKTTESYEPNEIYVGDCLEISYKGKLIQCDVFWAGAGFGLGSDKFPDGFIWMTEIRETQDDDCWIESAKIIGNIHNNKIDPAEWALRNGSLCYGSSIGRLC